MKSAWKWEQQKVNKNAKNVGIVLDKEFYSDIRVRKKPTS